MGSVTFFTAICPHKARRSGGRRLHAENIPVVLGEHEERFEGVRSYGFGTGRFYDSA